MLVPTRPGLGLSRPSRRLSSTIGDVNLRHAFWSSYRLLGIWMPVLSTSRCKPVVVAVTWDKPTGLLRAGAQNSGERTAEVAEE
jgi:hypothetical protein